MYNQPYFIPGYYSTMVPPTMMRGAMTGAGAMMNGVGTAARASRGLGLFGRLGHSFSALRAFNWGGFINNASKTLGVINQTIPLVRQVGPMVNNMKSMMRVASVFKDETDRKPIRRKNNQKNYQTSYQKSLQQGHTNQVNRNDSTKHESNPEMAENTTNRYDYNVSPTFFIPS